MKGETEQIKPIFPNQSQWVPIWVDDDKGPDWMQVGEGEGDPGTSWLEESNGRQISRHTDANNNEFGNGDWNTCIVYWSRIFQKGQLEKRIIPKVKPPEP